MITRPGECQLLRIMDGALNVSKWRKADTRQARPHPHAPDWTPAFAGVRWSWVGVGLLAASLEPRWERVRAVVADAQDHFACDGGDRQVGVEVGEEGAAA